MRRYWKSVSLSPSRPVGPGDHRRLGRLGEGQLDDRVLDRGQPVEQELRVEAGRDVLALDWASISSVASASSPCRRRG